MLFGTAVGDALGLPAENLSPQRIERWWPGPMRMRFVFGRGMISDDTEHTLLVAQSLLTHPKDPGKFQRKLAWKLRWWFLGLPAGVGMATAKACLRMWLGVPLAQCAVKSAGSGSAMRSAIIGVFFAQEPERRREFVLASSRLTHRSWQAETAALAVAEAAALAATSDGTVEMKGVMTILRRLSAEPEWQKIVLQMEAGLEARTSISEFVRSLGLERGVSGYALHVVPVALYAWLRQPADFRTALSEAIKCGGDTDTVGAVLGGLLGASLGRKGIPEDWVNRLAEWPRTQKYLEAAAQRLARQKHAEQPLGPVPWFWPAQLPRNLLFLAIVLVHGFRRLAPPY